LWANRLGLQQRLLGFAEYLKEHGIVPQYTTPRTLEQNGLSEDEREREKKIREEHAMGGERKKK
jgi:hypothetical protein